jgi:hypothetical protein
MNPGIFLVADDGDLVEMTEQVFKSEDELHSLLEKHLEKHPSLLVGDQPPGQEPLRLALVRREMGVPAEEGKGARWSVDLLFLDSHGIPTLVEVKRSTDTRIRREVVGQMLDYAANAVLYWPIEQLRERFSQTHDNAAEQFLLELVGGDATVDEFWTLVQTNLLAGRIRMVFVADGIPPELQRIVEFLNEQLRSAEVLAIEIKQYISDDHKTTTLVPRVIGQTAAAQQAKGTGEPGRTWDEKTLLADLLDRKGPQQEQVAQRLIDWSRTLFPRLWFGSGRIYGSVSPILDHAGREYWAFSLNTTGQVTIPFRQLATRPPFEDDAKLREYLDRLNRISGLNFGEDALEGMWPGFSLQLLEPHDDFEHFKAAVQWVVHQIKNHQAAES